MYGERHGVGLSAAWFTYIVARHASFCVANCYICPRGKGRGWGDGASGGAPPPSVGTQVTPSRAFSASVMICARRFRLPRMPSRSFTYSS